MKRRSFLSLVALAPLLPKLGVLSAPTMYSTLVLGKERLELVKSPIHFASLTPTQRKVWSRETMESFR